MHKEILEYLEDETVVPEVNLNLAAHGMSEADELSPRNHHEEVSPIMTGTNRYTWDEKDGAEPMTGNGSLESGATKKTSKFSPKKR